MTGGAGGDDAMGAFAARVDDALRAFLDTHAREADAVAAEGGAPVREVARLVAAGGKRLRPAFCYWGFRAAGGRDGDPIVRAAAALELLHTMALAHDDLLDGTAERRGQPTTKPYLAGQAAALAPAAVPEAFGTASAVLVGDLAAVLADRLMLDSGFEPAALVRALDVYHRMRIDTAVGQFLDVAGRGMDPSLARSVARLKGGAYTVEGPLLIGAALAEAPSAVRDALAAYGGSLGEAFQLRDDLDDRDAAPGVTQEAVERLVAGARAVLVAAPIEPDARDALDRMARLVGAGSG